MIQINNLEKSLDSNPILCGVNLKIGDRVLFLLCYFDPITFRSISQKNYIPLVLLCGEPEGILCKADEEMTVLDW